MPAAKIQAWKERAADNASWLFIIKNIHFHNQMGFLQFCLEVGVCWELLPLLADSDCLRRACMCDSETGIMSLEGLTANISLLQKHL